MDLAFLLPFTGTVVGISVAKATGRHSCGAAFESVL